MNINKINEIYFMLQHLRCAKTFMTEIYKCEYYINNFNENEAILFLNFIIGKYEKSFKQISLIIKEITVYTEAKGIYLQKSCDEEISDLVFVRNCLIIIMASNCGMGSIEKITKRCL